ncbi:hypothetical protein GCM10025859_13620 [Alicyclobacillus fastidiosus]|nr:hypothetical protein GCM10025859_13620 [Alicyclobacillus fastidiosus]
MNARLKQGFLCRKTPALVQCISFTDEAECQMGKWREVSARAQRPFARDDWVDTCV